MRRATTGRSGQPYTHPLTRNDPHTPARTTRTRKHARHTPQKPSTHHLHRQTDIRNDAQRCLGDNAEQAVPSDDMAKQLHVLLATARDHTAIGLHHLHVHNALHQRVVSCDAVRVHGDAATHAERAVGLHRARTRPKPVQVPNQVPERGTRLHRHRVWRGVRVVLNAGHAAHIQRKPAWSHTVPPHRVTLPSRRHRHAQPSCRVHDMHHISRGEGVEYAPHVGGVHASHIVHRRDGLLLGHHARTSQPRAGIGGGCMRPPR